MIGPEKARHCQTWLQRLFSKNKNLQLKRNLKSWKKCWKIEQLWAKKPWILQPWESLEKSLEYCRSCWKYTGSENLRLRSTLATIRVLNEKSVSDSGNLCSLRLMILRSIFASCFVSYLRVTLRPFLCLLSLVSLDCWLRLLEYFFESFSKTETAFSFFFSASRPCSMPR